MDNVAVVVAKDLDFDMSRSLNELLEKQRSVAERCSCLRARSLESILNFLVSQHTFFTHRASLTIVSVAIINFNQTVFSKTVTRQNIPHSFTVNTFTLN